MSDRTVYRHYKGGRYEVVTLAVASETHEPMIVYRNLDTAQVWVRPSEMFFGVVTVDGQEVRRFQAERRPPAHDAGPTTAECAAADRRYWDHEREGS